MLIITTVNYTSLHFIISYYVYNSSYMFACSYCVYIYIYMFNSSYVSTDLQLLQLCNSTWEARSTTKMDCRWWWCESETSLSRLEDSESAPVLRHPTHNNQHSTIPRLNLPWAEAFFRSFSHSCPLQFQTQLLSKLRRKERSVDAWMCSCATKQSMGVRHSMSSLFSAPCQVFQLASCFSPVESWQHQRPSNRLYLYTSPMSDMFDVSWGDPAGVDGSLLLFSDPGRVMLYMSPSSSTRERHPMLGFGST